MVAVVVHTQLRAYNWADKENNEVDKAGKWVGKVLVSSEGCKAGWMPGTPVFLLSPKLFQGYWAGN